MPASRQLPESERTTSLSFKGSLLSISSSSSSSPSLPSALQPSAAHSSCSLASVSSAIDEPHRLWDASQSLSTRFCRRQSRPSFPDIFNLCRVFKVLFFNTEDWFLQLPAHLKSGLPGPLSAVQGFTVAAVHVLEGAAALLLSCCDVQPSAALLIQTHTSD